MKNLMRLVVMALPLCLLASCNLYAPFNSDNSATDYLEEATKCLDDGDFSCAIANYDKLPDGALKDQKLCTGYLAKSGLTLDVLLNIITQDQSTMLGDLAQALTPWNTTRASDSANAKSNCVAFAAESPADPNAPLLEVMGYLMECSVLIAKTDLYQGSSATDTACTTPGPDSGHLIQNDIIGASGTAMCQADAITCGKDLYFISQPAFQSTLNQAGLGDISGALSLLPTQFQFDTSNFANSSLAADAYRSAIQSTLPVN